VNVIILVIVLLTIICTVNFLITLALSRRIGVITAAQAGLLGNTLLPGDLAPEFIAEKLGGGVVTLGNYRGKSLGLIFVSPSCKPCTDAIPVYEASKAEADQSGINLVLVSIAGMSETKEYIEKMGITLPVINAPRISNPFFQNYRVSGTPSYYLIDIEGRIQTIGYPIIENGKLLL